MWFWFWFYDNDEAEDIAVTIAKVKLDNRKVLLDLFKKLYSPKKDLLEQIISNDIPINAVQQSKIYLIAFH